MAPFLPLLFFLLLNDEVDSPVPQGFLRTSVHDIVGCKGRESERRVILHGGRTIPQTRKSVVLHGGLALRQAGM